MFRLLVHLVRSASKRKSRLALEMPAARHPQVEKPQPTLRRRNRTLWVALSKIFESWKHRPIIVQPEAVIRCTGRASSTTGARSRKIRIDQRSIQRSLSSAGFLERIRTGARQESNPSLVSSKSMLPTHGLRPRPVRPGRGRQFRSRQDRRESLRKGVANLRHELREQF